MVVKYRRVSMSILNRFKQLTAAGIALTSFAEASSDTVTNIPTAIQTYTAMDARKAAIELYNRFKAVKRNIPDIDNEILAQIAHNFVQDNNISDKTVYDMTLNYSKYITEYVYNSDRGKVSTDTLRRDTEALYFAFTQTDFYKTERDKIIKRWMPIAEKVSEGYHPYGYKCTANQPTIGIGTCLTTSGLSLNDIPIRRIQKDDKGKFMYKDGEPVPGTELTLAEKERFVSLLEQLNSNSYEAGAKATRNAGIYGLTLDDARRVASLEARKKMDQVLKFAFFSQGIDMFQQPSSLGVLALDIHYQCGNLTSTKQWPKFWECVCTRRYGDLKKQIKVNGGRNKNRHNVKEALCDHIAADYAAQNETNIRKKAKAWTERNLAYERICGYGIDIYGLTRREGNELFHHKTSGSGMAKALSPSAQSKLKKREITPEQRAEFERKKAMIDGYNVNQSITNQQQNSISSDNNAPYIRTSQRRLEELQRKTLSLPQGKRAKPLSSQELTRLAKQHKVNPRNLIHLTTNGRVDINVCLDYLKQETQKINNAAMRRNRAQGR